MGRVGSQQRTLLELLGELRPHWRRDRALPVRIQAALARRRSFGSRDRRLYRELIYVALRYLPWVERELDRDAARAVQVMSWLSTDTRDTAAFRQELLADWPPCPPTAADKALALNRSAPPAGAACVTAELLPAWLPSDAPEAFAPPQLDALLARAPLWLRAQGDDPHAVQHELAAAGLRVDPSAVLPGAFKVAGATDATQTAAFARGLFEVQDLGSQLLLASGHVTPGSRWLDGCAGAGGKTLQLAHLVGPKGQVDAFDVRAHALAELRSRAHRARLRNIVVLSHRPDGAYDGVLVDAPCTGSGTWRRAPHLKWTTADADVLAAADVQQQLLDDFSTHVKPGGQLVYATCSLSRRENERVVEHFLTTHPNFSAEAPSRDFGAELTPFGLRVWPAVHDTDGFFVAHLRRAH